MHGVRECAYGRGGVYVHGEREGCAYGRGGVYVHGKREGVAYGSGRVCAWGEGCIWKGSSVRAWRVCIRKGWCMHGRGEGGCVHMEGVQCASWGKGVCIWKSLSVHAWAEGGCMHIWKV